MNEYMVLKQQIFSDRNYQLVPIRSEDRYEIMHWRNQQVYHLRQKGKLSHEDQDHYFNTVIRSLFNDLSPDQILFSFLKEGICIGYGGIVHINWNDRNAEISFIMETAREINEFDLNWTMFLKLIEEVWFEQLEGHKLYVYAFDLRPHLYTTLIKNEYFLDARLKDHCYVNNEFKDVVIHSKLNLKK